MPPYDFDDQDWLRKTLDRLATRQQPQEVLGEQQELPAQNSVAQPQSGTDTMNLATTNGLRKAGADIPPPIDPIALKHYVPRLLESKKMYETADNADYQTLLGMGANQIRENAMSNADYWRNAADKAGYDLSMVGRDVSLDDSYKNLQENNARAINDILNGKFALPSDQYFSKAYSRLMREGFTADKAKEIAIRESREYQGQRVGYLRGMYYGYGNDADNVMTPIGREAINSIALEMPSLANAYLNENPSMKDAYSEYNANARQAAALDNALAIATMGNENALKAIALQGQVARDNATHTGGITRENMKYENSLTEKLYEHNKDVDFRYNLRTAAEKAKMSQQELDQKTAYLAKLAMDLKLPDDIAKQLIIAGVTGHNINLRDSLGAERANKTVEYLNARNTALTSQYKEIVARLADPDLNEDLRKALEGDLADTKSLMSMNEQIVQQILGVGTPSTTLPPIANDLETGDNDKQLIEALVEAASEAGHTQDEIIQGIQDYFKSQGASKEYLQKIAEHANALVANKTGGKK